MARVYRSFRLCLAPGRGAGPSLQAAVTGFGGAAALAEQAQERKENRGTALRRGSCRCRFFSVGALSPPSAVGSPGAGTVGGAARAWVGGGCRRKMTVFPKFFFDCIRFQRFQ
jgi:hypothetical protein